MIVTMIVTVPTEGHARQSWKGNIDMISSVIWIFYIYDEISLKSGQNDLYKSIFGIKQN